MFKYVPVKDQLQQERKKTARLQSSLDKANADIEYIAMMTDIELDDETEVDSYDAQ